MKSLAQQLTQYAEYHRDRRNIATHFVGIPMIVLAVAILLSRPALPVSGMSLSLAVIVAVGVCAYYLLLSRSLGLVMTLLMALCVWAGSLIAAMDTQIWLISGIGLFVVGWVFQFVGHLYEGRKPAFVDDLIGLVIGPLFVVTEGLFAFNLKLDLQQQIEDKVGPVH